ncbi:MAG: PQQ-binding-like beta-propeller repeat protein, partial [Vicinamibacterales bacterium]|nr:PQQ-binding-like beta-propeller repeat protein [Vicinamibacterales bacterium]
MIRLVVLLLALVSCATQVAAQVRTQPGAGDEWQHYGGDAGSTRYSSLAQIDQSNVSDLQVAWRWKTDSVGPPAELDSRVTPIMTDGVLYATAGSRRAVVAIDAATGETLWSYSVAEGTRGDSPSWASSGRGLAYRTGGDDARVLLVTPGFHLISLDAGTGQPDPGFGADGIVDLKEGLDPAVDPEDGRLGSSAPPLVVNDVVVVGAALSAGGALQAAERPQGHISGYDARTGERLWIFYTVPRPGELGHDTWEQSSWRTDQAGVSAPMSADEELGYVYAVVGAATGEDHGGHRPGDNLFSQSLVCLDARTGERVWHFQLVHHGLWDFDIPSAPILADIEVEGRPIQALIQPTKQ